MFEAVQRQTAELRRLALEPTPSNYESINTGLQHLLEFLSDPELADYATLQGDAGARDFFLNLRKDMSSLQVLMQYPLTFYRGLSTLRAREFGAYVCSGSLRSLEVEPAATTVMHL